MKPFGFFTKDGQKIPLMPNKPSGVLSLPIHGAGISVLPKKQVIPDKYKELSKSYAISFGKKGREQSLKGARFAMKKGKKFIEEKKLKEKLEHDIKKDLKGFINFRSKKEEEELENLITEQVGNNALATKSPEEREQMLRKLLREQENKKKFDFEFKNDVNEQIIGGDPQRNVLITNRGKEIPAPKNYYDEEKSQTKESKPTPAEKKEVVDMYLGLLPSGARLIAEGN